MSVQYALSATGNASALPDTAVGDEAGPAIGVTSAVILGFLLPAGLRICALSHNRSASSEISIPKPAKPARIAAIDSPARRSVSSSLRWGSSWSVLGFFGQRALATNSVSVGFTVGVIPEWFCSAMGVMRERYVERRGSAIGVALLASKPAGLDVGVLTYAFVFILYDALSSIFGFIVSEFVRLIDSWVFVLRVWVELVYLGSWFLRLVSFFGRIVLGFWGLGLRDGGAGC
ncbi:MAG: hypothetical protein KBH45_06665 [Verrucomicrobia bacterium]|nr:hypothetical protein [Verrucomicrobiota bacterium]